MCSSKLKVFITRPGHTYMNICDIVYSPYAAFLSTPIEAAVQASFEVSSIVVAVSSPAWYVVYKYVLQ